MSEDTTKAIKKQKRADTIFKGAIVAFLVYLATIATVGVYQTYQVAATVAKNQKINSQASEDRFARYTAENERQHNITQNYVKCLLDTFGTALQKPIHERTSADFSMCVADDSIASTTQSSKAISPYKVSSEATVVKQPNSPVIPAQTTSAPPPSNDGQSGGNQSSQQTPILDLLRGVQPSVNIKLTK